MRRTVFCGVLFLAGAILISVPTAFAESNLMAHWKFDEGEGNTAYDSSDNGNYGTLVNGPVWTSGPIDGALEFDGVNDYVLVTNDSSLDISGAITVSAWIKLSNYANNQSIAGKIESGGGYFDGGYRLFFNNGTGYSDGNFRLVFQKSSGTAGTGSGNYGTNTNWDRVVSEKYDWETGVWYHVAAMWDGTTDSESLKMYINGVPDASHTASQSTIKTNNFALHIGSFFGGKIDDVRIYDRVLSAGEVVQLYQEGCGGRAFTPSPADGTTGVRPDVVLSWRPGEDSNSHDVYFGTDYNDVNGADTNSPEYMGNFDVNSFDPCGLDFLTAYYWRIDEVNGVNTRKGKVWNFTTLILWKYYVNFPDDPLTSEVIFEGDPRWVKFTIKLDDPCTVYFQNSKLCPFHYQFATEWLEPFIGMSVEEYYNVAFYDANQQASLGAVIFPPMEGAPPEPKFSEYGIQFVRYDPYTKEEIAAMFTVVKTKVISDPCVTAYYFPTYEQQQVAEENEAWFEAQGIPIGSVAQWYEGNICYSEGWAIGELKYFPGDQIQSAYVNGDLLPEDILLTDGVPAEVPFVAGIITLSPSAQNSHVAILSRTYGIPFVYLANDSDIEEVLQLVNHLTLLCVYQVGETCSVQLSNALATLTPNEISELFAMKELMPLDISPMAAYGSYGANTDNLLPEDINHFGGKAANYGMLRQSIPESSPVAAALSFDVWNDFLDQPLTPSDSVVIPANGYVVFWADDEPGQGARHTTFKLSKSGEDIGLSDVDGSLIDGFSFGVQTTDVSYGRMPDGNDTWSLFYDGDISPNAPNPGGSGVTGEGLFINEFMADNDNIVADEHGDYDDWIEIYNSEPMAIDLGGMYLTDDLEDPTKWMISVGITGSTLREEIANRLAGYTYPVSDLAALSADLAAIRNIITNPNITSFSPQMQDAIIAVLEDPNYGFDPNEKIRFRSSTNMEDAEKFTGAGLYNSYSGCLADDLDSDESGPCICDANESNERGVFRAIRKVFASFYNDNAYLERLRRDVNEAEVGMAMLVHHSFPDEFELANGVATMEKKGSPEHWDIKLSTQKGAVPVTNPEEGALPEEVSVYAEPSGGMAMTLIRQSNLVILGETVMEWQADYNDLVSLLVAAAEKFEQVTGKAEYILDFEYKKVAAGGAAIPVGGVVVKQIREIPPLDEVDSTCPYSDYNCPPPPYSYSFLVTQWYEDSNVLLKTSYYLYCPDGVVCASGYYFYGFCRTVIRGYTTRPIVMFTGTAEKTHWGFHWSWVDFYFTPHLEPGISQCLLNQLRAKDIRVIHLHIGSPNSVETSGFGSGPYYLGDFEPDGDVDMFDFSRFAQRWQDSDCGLCSRADLDCDEEVGLGDLAMFVDSWLAGVE